MIVASEDLLGEVVVRKLISVVRPDLRIGVALGNRGKGYLRAKAQDLNHTARSIPVFALIDLDVRQPCPADLLTAWLRGAPEANKLFRVAVMEVESWVLADRDRCSAFLGVPTHRIPTDTDALEQPKEFLVNLARRSRRREIREELVPSAGSIAPVGPAYNLRLSAFVTADWNPGSASPSSESLRRAIGRLRTAF